MDIEGPLGLQDQIADTGLGPHVFTDHRADEGHADRDVQAGEHPARRRRQIDGRSEERRVGKSVSVRVDLGGCRIIKKKHKSNSTTNRRNISPTTTNNSTIETTTK